MKISDSTVSLIKQTKRIQENEKNTGAEYAYKADCNGDWGDIGIDFVEGKGRILYIAEWDTLKSQTYAQRVISYILNCKPEELPKNPACRRCQCVTRLVCHLGLLGGRLGDEAANKYFKKENPYIFWTGSTYRRGGSLIYLLRPR